MAEELETKENDDEVFEKLLNEFISTQLKDVDDVEKSQPEPQPRQEEDVSIFANHDEQKAADDEWEGDEEEEEEDNPELAMLKSNEKALYKAYANFQEAIDMLAGEIKAKPVKFKIVPQSLYPNYKPSTGKMIAEDISSGWELLIKAEPEMMGRISPNGSDEELLAFAEESENDAVQFALISYVEILIEMEGCEIVYKERLLKYEQKRLEREIYEEHEKRIRRINRYIEAIKAKKFPVDAEKLVKNYFKTAAKDAEGAFQVLTHNPAIFSPIEFSKIKPRLFGLLKVKPSDGIRINHSLGEFLRKLKV